MKVSEGQLIRAIVSLMDIVEEQQRCIQCLAKAQEAGRRCGELLAKTQEAVIPKIRELEAQACSQRAAIMRRRADSME